MKITIALAGNPNCGKTTLFNALTGSNQFVGNWPGVTVEKKEGKLKKHNDVVITDLPGIYSLSPYTLEEVVARDYLIGERPNAILNIIDGTNLERNLYLTTQLVELGIPVVVAINMMDVVKKNGDKINTQELSRELGCPVVEISALKGTGIQEAAEAAVQAAQNGHTVPQHTFTGVVEHALAHIEEAAVHNLPEEQQRWYAIKIFERDDKVLAKMDLDAQVAAHIEEDIKAAEEELDDDAESIITNERYVYIASIIKGCYKKKQVGKLSTSDKIDKIVTNRWLGLPIFAVVMFLVYYISMVTVGSSATDWANDGVFGDGWHLFWIGTSQAADAEKTYGDTDDILAGFIDAYGTEDMANAIDTENENYSDANAKAALAQLVAATPADASVTYTTEDEETLEKTDHTGTKKAALEEAVANYENTDYKEGYGAPDASEYGVWVPGIPVLLGNLLEKANSPEWLSGLLLDGIVAGVGAVLGFVPQMLVLFFLLAILEGCGYMSRIAFVLDRIFRKFGLSGKSFIPMLIGTGCGIPGVMASRTIENERDRRMTIMTTTFIPCGAKVPFIAMIAGAIFGGSAWVSTSAYFIGMAAIIVSGIMLKKTKMFAGDPAPFVMELPAYHVPAWGNVFRATWERGWSFIKRAGSVILAATVVLWFLQGFGFENGVFGMVEDQDNSVLAAIATKVAWIFAPLGFGNWRATVASVSGLIAKENVVGTFGVLYHFGGELSENGDEIWAAVAQDYTALSAYAFMIFNLLCAPCFAAMGAIKREMNNGKWTAIAIGYMCALAYCAALVVYQLGGIITGEVGFNFFTIVAAVVLVGFIYLLVRPNKYAGDNEVKIDISKI